MTNSTSTQSAQRSALPLSVIICFIGLLALIVMALVAAIAWNSPIGFFLFLAGSFFCAEPVSNHFRYE